MQQPHWQKLGRCSCAARFHAHVDIRLVEGLFSDGQFTKAAGYGILLFSSIG